MASVAVGDGAGEGIAARLARAWLPAHGSAEEILTAVLILCADHELNVSAFTARCVASSGASLYAVVGAALGALQGFRHGGASRRVEALWREVDVEGDAQRVIRDRLERGETCPGFGHVIYNHTDPRARMILELIAEHFPQTDALQRCEALRTAVRDAIGLECNLDLATAALRRAAGLPPDAALTLFALGRAAGWIAHAMEQYETGQLIRPRAKYVGVEP
jgi:citrate synthase